MKKSEIQVGGRYVIKVSGKLTTIKIDFVHPLGGWFGTNERTGRQIRVLTAAKLRGAVLTLEERRTLRRAIAGAMLGVRALFGARYSAPRRAARICLENSDAS